MNECDGLREELAGTLKNMEGLKTIEVELREEVSRLKKGSEGGNEELEKLREDFKKLDQHLKTAERNCEVGELKNQELQK